MDPPAKPTAASASPLAELQRSIVARAREFEISALLDLLASLGYEAAEVAFRGHLSASPQPTLVHEVELAQPPRAHGFGSGAPAGPGVTITVNLGLTSCRSPLPSYLLRLCQQLETQHPMRELLDLLDRSLLHARLTSDQPDRMLDGWADVQRDFLRIHGLDSPMGLHWLFRHVFPELGVHVHRITDDYRVPFAAARLGYSSLGHCSFGTTSRLSVHELEVTLVSRESTLGGVSWPRIADHRIRRFVLPLLDEVCMNLTVAFLLLDRSTRARLHATSYVGYDPMWADEPDEPDEAHAVRQEPEPPAEPEPELPPARIVLYRGALPHTEPSTDELEQARELVLATGEHQHLRVQRASGSPPRWAIDGAMPRGTALDLVLRCEPSDGQAFAYDVAVCWGVRAWYTDDPFEITVTHHGLPKANVDPRHHPNLWQWLRNEARAQLADVIAIETTVLEDDERIGVELVERLIARHDAEGLSALSLSRRTPQERWDEAAWQRFLQWSEDQ